MTRASHARPATPAVVVRPAEAADAAEWLRMRTTLWPEAPDDHPGEIRAYFERPPPRSVTLVAALPGGGLAGFLEAGTRRFAEGCGSSPVGYIEGWWVDPAHRRRGIGQALVAAAEAWARQLGCTEMASDAERGNAGSRAAHVALGYAEVAEIVCYRKGLA